MPKAKEQSKELAPWEEKLMEDAKKVAHNEGSDVSAITISQATMYYHDQAIPDNNLNVIVLASSTERCYYDKPYDPDTISSPRCFAQSLDPKELNPHENVKEPISPTCDVCPLAEFGSAKTGRGPACKTYRKLAMIPADTPAEEVAKAEIAYLKVSPTSVKNWQKYATGLVAQTGIPPWATRTNILVKPDKKTQWQILFSGVELLKDEPDLLAAVHARIDDAEEKIMRPYTYDEEDEETASERY